MEDNIRRQIDSIVDEVLLLSQELRKNLNGTYDENELRNALLTLIATETALYGKLATIFKNQANSKIIEFAALARLLLESHAVICWILKDPAREYGRSKRFMNTGWDLQVHYNRIFKNGYGKAKRTRTRLESTETLLKTVNSTELLNWYDELNYFIHPSSAVLTQSSLGGIEKTIGFGVWVAGNIFADSVLKISNKLDFGVDIQDIARHVHELDFTSSN